MPGTAVLVPLLAVVLVVSAANAPPAAGRAILPGTPIVVEGTVVMIVEDDFLRGRATRRYFLDEAGSQRRYDLTLTPRQVDVVQPGMRVRVIGTLADGVLTPEPGERSVVVLEGPPVVAPGGTR